MPFDVASVRAHFPALRGGTAFFDGPGGSQTPDVVARAVADTLTSAISNRGTVTAAERRADAVVGEFRSAFADLLGADPGGVVFGRSATSLTYDLGRALAKHWVPGDEVVVTRLDHDSNVRPWVQLAEAAGATVRWVDFDPATGELSAEAVAAAVGERTRLVATTAASNLIGTRPPTRRISELAHAVGALHWVDGVHATAHASVDLLALGADVWTCSPYKFMGPHCGVLAADPALLETLHPDKLLPSTDAVPERFELGTLPYELLAGATATVDFIAGLADLGDGGSASTAASTTPSSTGIRPPSTRDRRARQPPRADRAGDEGGARPRAGAPRRARAGAAGAARRDRAQQRRLPHPHPALHGRGPRRAGHSGRLAERDVNAPAGHFYAIECSRHLGLGDTGGVRVGLAPYTTADDVDHLVTALTDVLRQA